MKKTEYVSYKKIIKENKNDEEFGKDKMHTNKETGTNYGNFYKAKKKIYQKIGITKCIRQGEKC